MMLWTCPDCGAVLSEADKLSQVEHVYHQRGAADLRRENERLRSALTQFADRENWQIGEPDAFGATNYEWIGDGPDPFEKAAAALAGGDDEKPVLSTWRTVAAAAGPDDLD